MSPIISIQANTGFLIEASDKVMRFPLIHQALLRPRLNLDHVYGSPAGQTSCRHKEPRIGLKTSTRRPLRSRLTPWERVFQRPVPDLTQEEWRRRWWLPRS